MKKYFNVIVRLYNIYGEVYCVYEGIIITYENMVEGFFNEYYVSGYVKENTLHIRLKNNETGEEQLEKLPEFLEVTEDTGYLFVDEEKLVQVEITEEVKDATIINYINKQIKVAKRAGEI